MSTTTTTTTIAAIIITDKFKKELDKFFIWTKESNYTIKNRNDDICEWSHSLINNYEEPSRNKLEVYIKKLSSKYLIYYNGDGDGDEPIEIQDAKLLVNEFKNSIKDKKETKETKVKKEKKSIDKKLKNSNDESIQLDLTLDSNKTEYVTTLDFSTKELIYTFNQPKELSTNNYEWVFKLNNNIYSIYNADDDEDEDFNDKTWHLAAQHEIKKEIQHINNHIKTQNQLQKPKSIKVQKEQEQQKEQKEQKEQEQKEQEQQKEQQKEQYQDQDQEDIIIEIDDIDFSDIEL